MKVLGLTSYPVEAAATRYRLVQFIRPLAERGITITVRPFLDSEAFAGLYRRENLPHTVLALINAGLRRVGNLSLLRQADAVFVQREAMLFGPPFFEWMTAQLFKRPLVLDLDDATYVTYTSPTYGKFGQVLKWVGKTDDLIRWASVVTCGNQAIADYAESKGATARIIPTVVDTDVFCPKPHRAGAPVLGWIGSHSTFPYLQTIFPVLQDLARTHRFKLKVVGAGVAEVNVPGVEVENLEWTLKREVEDFQSLDIGLYPIVPSLYAEQWAAGKSGLKAIQYMAIGVPYVATPFGVMANIGEAGVTHLQATTSQEWFKALDHLLSDSELRQTMGTAGRRHVVEHYLLSDQADKLAAALRLAGDMKTS